MRARMQTQPGQLPHIPADLYRQLPDGTDARQVVIVQAAPRSYVGPVVLVLVATVGIGAVLFIATAAVLQLAAVAATTATAIQSAVPALVGGGGLVTLALRKGK
jgi:hypothetical protein